MSARSIAHVRRDALLLTVVAGIAAAVGAVRNSDQFFHSYLVSVLLCFSIASGCLTWWLLGNLTGGAWTLSSRTIFQAGATTLPLVALFFIPILAKLEAIYPWAEDKGQALLTDHQVTYFHTPFFIARTILYFVIWIVLALLLHERASRRVPILRSRAIAAVGLVLFLMCITWASTDWMMSLEPQWSSTLYGVIFMIGNALASLAFAIIILNWRRLLGIEGADLGPDQIHDFGKLLMGFCMLWMYMYLSQFMTVWHANLPEEINWYLIRGHSWIPLGVSVVLVQFFFPFLLMLSRARKRSFPRLVRVAGIILVAHVLNIAWLIIPDFSPRQFSIRLIDVTLPLALGGLWFSYFLTRFKRIEGL